MAELGSAESLAARVLAGEVRAGARLMRLIDDEVALGAEALAHVYRAGREAHLIGVTGGPGAGKSSLSDQLIAHYRALGKRVGVVAVDPTSPISGGAVLGDRVRMQRHALDEGVFVRSLAARGAYGGLSASASSTARVLEGMGYDPVLIETVGIGQSEVDIARVAETVLVVMSPGLGDDVQAMKAGLLEVPDVFVVNKADREGAERLVRELEMIHGPPVVKTNAVTGEGVPELAAAIATHRAGMSEEARNKRKFARAKLEIETALYGRLRANMVRVAGGEDAIDEAAARVATRNSDVVAELEKLFAGR